MTRIGPIVAALLLAATAVLAEQPDLDSLKWVARPLVVFADAPEDPKFIQQMAWIEADPQPLIDRRVVVLTDTDPEANGPLRQRLRPRGFGLVLIDTDGRVAQRRPLPATVREISSMIDRTPSRRQETGSHRP
ncbi:DUF4174 domain-containing protein [uncultured Amaricoccus sp.]|uniref:DUF4174 domain-containing protein n=1 Tax=uncultured Amaricoccus sp. TaxID=339341 RepID=UPI0026141419|nr:DUF4174 domain-containing protein [uncultured Amaricoccus sp.]